MQTANQIQAILKEELANNYEGFELQSIIFIILEHFFELSKVDVLVNNIATKQVDLTPIIADLKNNRPIQYIVGSVNFYGLNFLVNEHTLIPRPETEELVDIIINNTNSDTEILEIGTGTGCIPISLKKNILNSFVSSIDVSEKAIETAKLNATNNRVEVDFLHQDILTTTNNLFTKKFDVIVSNPPYVLNSEKLEMQKNVLDHEPHLALFVDDNDPLIFYNKITGLATHWLKPNGTLYYEINEAFGTETKQMLEKHFAEVQILEDLYGKERFAIASNLK